MTPMDRSAVRLTEEIHSVLTRIESFAHRYHDCESTLLIDNRRMLHGRESLDSGAERSIESVVIY